MVPGVAAEEDLVACRDHADLAVLRVREDELALEHAVHDVGREDRLVGRAVPELPARLEPELQHVQGRGRDVDPVGHQTGLGVSPRRGAPCPGAG